MRGVGGIGALILAGMNLADIARAEGFTLDMCESPSTKGWAFYCSEPVTDAEEEL